MVSDKEVSSKVYQALREKTQWSSLKEETADDKPNSPTPATVKRSDDDDDDDDEGDDKDNDGSKNLATAKVSRSVCIAKFV
jgi:hypothetical protein